MNDIIDLLEKYKKTTTKGMEHDFQKLKSIPVDRKINNKPNRLVLSICMTTFVIILTITIVLFKAIVCSNVLCLFAFIALELV